MLGLFIGTLLAFLIDYLDDTLKTAADIERALGTVTLGRIPRGAGLLAPPDASTTTSPVARVLERTG